MAHPRGSEEVFDRTTTSPEEAEAWLVADADLDRIVRHLGRTRAFDLHVYRRAIVVCAIDRRLALLRLSSYAEYARYLEASPAEGFGLIDAVLVRVTAFFRDPPVWAALARAVAALPADKPLRIWTAGCATGQEAYSLAMLTAEVLGQAAAEGRVRIYATDIDPRALEVARRGIYAPAALQAVPPPFRRRYFRARDDAYVFSPELRRLVVFGRHDLLRDPPLSRIDVLLCRNVLIFIEPHFHSHILERFHFALRDGGLLLVGPSELFGAGLPDFTIVDPRHRLFTTRPAAPPAKCELELASARIPPASPGPRRLSVRAPGGRGREL